jgi:stage III sporulation protein AE
MKRFVFHRFLSRLLLTVTFLLLLAVPALAQEAPPSSQSDGQALFEEPSLFQEQLEASGAQSLPDNLPKETQELLDKLGITELQSDAFAGLQPNGVLDTLLGMVSEQAGGPLRAAGIVLGIVLLSAMMDGMRQTLREPAVSEVFGAVCALAACAAVLIPVSGVIRTVCAAAQSTSIFMTSYVPVYAGVLITSGQAVTAASYNTVVLFAAELITLLATHVVVPLMTVSLALGLVGSINSGLRLDAVSGLINKTAVWLLGITTTLFVGLLSLQGIVGGAADSLSGRAIRFSLSSMVPVVGGALSEAFTAVKGCLTLLKTTLGGFGILATALIVLPPLIQCALWSLCLSVCGAAADLFELEPISALLRSAQSVVKTLIGVLAACSLFMIIATAIVTLAGNGAV